MIGNIKNNLGENYNPLYFLGALGSGGLTVAYYMFFHFMVDHGKIPFATADYVFPLVQKGNFVSILIVLNMIMIVYLAFTHFRLLIWNIFEYRRFKESPGYDLIRTTNNEVTLMAAPLTFSMSINVLFILGALFTPKLWDYVEYLFPFSFLGFFVVGIVSLKMFFRYVIRVITTQSFDFKKNNSLAQLIAPFTFSMVAVGFSAPGAMSHYSWVYIPSLFFGIFYSILTLTLTALVINNGFKSILKQGLNTEAGPTLWTIIPITTLIGITVYRMSFGFIHNFGLVNSKTWFFILTGGVVSIQLIFVILGLAVMISTGYLSKFIFGPSKSIPSLAIVCPGVAFTVYGFFFVHGGLVNSKVFTLFSLPYFIVLSIFIIVQTLTIYVMHILVWKLFKNDVEEPLP